MQQLQASLTHKDAEIEEHKAKLSENFNAEVQNYSKKLEAVQQAVAQRGEYITTGYHATCSPCQMTDSLVSCQLTPILTTHLGFSWPTVIWLSVPAFESSITMALNSTAYILRLRYSDDILHLSGSTAHLTPAFIQRKYSHPVPVLSHCLYCGTRFDNNRKVSVSFKIIKK